MCACSLFQHPHLFRAKGFKLARNTDVFLNFVRRLTAHDDRADSRQRQDVAHGLVHRDPTLTEQPALRAHLHANHPDASAHSFRQHCVDERTAMDIGRVQCDEHGVESETAHRLHQDGRIVMARQSHEPNAAFRPGPDECFEGSPFGKNAIQVRGSAEVMRLLEVEMTGAHSTEAIA